MMSVSLGRQERHASNLVEVRLHSQCGDSQDGAMQLDDGRLIVGVQVPRGVPLSRQFRRRDFSYESFLNMYEWSAINTQPYRLRYVGRGHTLRTLMLALCEHLNTPESVLSQCLLVRVKSRSRVARRSLRSGRLPNLLIVVVHALCQYLRGAQRVVSKSVQQCTASPAMFTHVHDLGGHLFVYQRQLAVVDDT
jgi:hypothetical protein